VSVHILMWSFSWQLFVSCVCMSTTALVGMNVCLGWGGGGTHLFVCPACKLWCRCPRNRSPRICASSRSPLRKRRVCRTGGDPTTVPITACCVNLS